MSIEQKIAELLEESKKRGLTEAVAEDEEAISEEEVKEESEDSTEVVAEGEMPAALKKAMKKKDGDDEDDEEDEDEDEDDVKKEGVGDVAQKAVNVVKKVAGVATGTVGAATGAMDGAVKGARRNYHSTANESIDVKEDVDALLNGEELSEEFKQKAETIFEAAVIARVKAETARLEEEFETRLNEQVEKNVEGLVEQVDGYLGYVAEQWIEQNELALERGMKSEILEGFVEGLKGLFEQHYIDVPEERYDVLGQMEEKVEELEDKLNEQVKKNIEAQKVISEHQRKEILDTAKEGLTDTEVEKLMGLAEELAFDDAETFAKKVQTIRESYFTNKAKSDTIVESVITDEPVEELTEEVKKPVDPKMAAYMSALYNK